MNTRDVLYILLVVLVGLGLIFAVSVFDKGENLTNGEGPIDNGSAVNSVDNLPETHNATVNDMNVTYHVVDEVEGDSGRGYREEYNENTDVCEIYLSREYLAGTPPAVFGMLGSLAHCYGRAELGFPTDNVDDDINFINRWIRLYNERCDKRVQPLGFPANDGSCENVPRFEEAT